MSEPIHSVKWFVDTKAEFLLKDGKVSFEIKELRFNDINLEESKARQSRLDRVLDTERVLSIAIAMEQGASLPMITVTKVKHVGFVVLAGLHRAFGVQAYINGRDNSYKIKVIMVLDGDLHYIHDAFPSLTNALEGEGLSFEARRIRAAELVINGGAKIEEVAGAFGLKVSSLDKYVADTKTREQLISKGVTIAKTLTKNSTIEALRGLSYSEVLLTHAAHFLSQNEMTHADAVRLIKNMKNAKSEGGALQCLSEYTKEQQLKETPDRQWSKAPRRTRFVSATTELLNLLKEYPSFAALQITVPEDREKVTDKLADLMERLIKLGAKP